VWGTDLSGNRTGAGGVGGLLWVNNVQSGLTAGIQFTAYDGNGNVAGLFAASDGSSTARYEYGPFGEPLRLTGTLAKANPVRWSTKVTDDEGGLVYYGYRYYNPATGRWLSRDPIEERGGANLVAMIGNDPIRRFDVLGAVAGVDDLVIGGAVAGALAIGYATSPQGQKDIKNAGQAIADAARGLGDNVISAAKTLAELIAEGTAEAVKRARKCLKRNKQCLPCLPPVGTIGFRYDVKPDSLPHNGIPAPHSHMNVLVQRSSDSPIKPCECYWFEVLKDPLPGIIPPPVTPPMGGGLAP
jgi:RHS repeat-associated protein